MGKDVVAEMPQVSSVGSALQRAIGSMELMQLLQPKSDAWALSASFNCRSRSYSWFLLSFVYRVQDTQEIRQKKPNDPINRSSSIGGFRNFILHSSSQDWVIRSDHHKKGLEHGPWPKPAPRQHQGLTGLGLAVRVNNSINLVYAVYAYNPYN